MTPHYIQVVLGVWFLFLSALIFCLRPCKSLIMNVSFGYHFMLCGILEIGFVLWVEDISFSTETLATLYVVLPVISHTLILMWAGYKITVCVSHHISDLKRALAMTRKAVLRLCRRHEYEELQDLLTHT